MPATSTAVNPRKIKITFTESDHKYSSVIGNKTIDYISGTTFVDFFFPKFDPTGVITRACAKREGLTVEELKMKWKEKADKSCIYGTKIHETMEDCLKGNSLRNKPSDLKETLAMGNAEKLSSKLLKKLDILGIEKIVFDERLKIAGTIDLLAKSKKDGRIWILDHKTNGCIETENRYNNFGLEPITNIPSTNYYHYQMQLNLYEFLLKYAGYIDKKADVGKALFHITENGVKTYVLENHQDDIKKMVKYYLKNGLKR